MRLSYNIPALTMNLIQNQALSRQSINSQRISSGYKIITAKDNPSGLVQSENIRMQIGGLQAASRDVQDGISMLQTAEGGLQEITNMVQRIRQLTVQAGNSTTTQEDKQVIQSEINQMLDGIDSVAGGTEFNGFKLLGNTEKISMPIGANSGESVNIPQIKLTKNSGSDDTQSKIGDLYGIEENNSVLNGNIDGTLNAIDGSLNQIVSIRSKYGALENRFENTFSNMQDLNDGMISADSSIRDADVSEEILNYSKESIIIQASNAMIAQANKLPQDVLNILSTFK